MSNVASFVYLECADSSQLSAFIRTVKSMAELTGVKATTSTPYLDAETVMTLMGETKTDTKNTSTEDLSLGGTMPSVTD